MSRSLTFLQLSAEFGGTKFGPFPGPEIRLGSDASRNDITLPEALGVLPEHVKILLQTDGSFIVAPTERTAAVHVFRGTQRPKHIATATALMVGDAFSLVTPEGPRFVLVAEAPPAMAKKKRGDAAKGAMPTKGGILAEFKRVGMAMFFRNRIGNMVQRGWTMVKTGTIFSPRYIVAFLMMGTGWFVAIGAGVAAMFAMFSLQGANDEVDDVKSDLAECQSMDQDEPDIFTLTQGILGDTQWYGSIKDDDDFRSAYVDSLRSAFEHRDKYRWVYTSAASDFTDAKRHFTNELGPAVGRVFAYVAAQQGNLTRRDWYQHSQTLDGNPDGGCGRGPARMTYLQGAHMGVRVTPDALMRTAIAENGDDEAMRSALLTRPGLPPSDRTEYGRDAWEIDYAPVGSSGAFSCLFLTGADDERTDARAVARAVKPFVGASARGVPGEGADFWITARLMRWFASDLEFGVDDVEWTRGAPSRALDNGVISSERRDRVIKNAADTVARAVAIPCAAELDKDSRDSAADIVGDLPSMTQCGIIYLLSLGEL